MKKETVPCNICGSENFRQVYDRHSYDMGIDTVICEYCGFVFTNPRPVLDEIAEFYRQDYRKSALSQKSRPFKSYNIRSNAYRRALWMCDIVKPLFEKHAIQKPTVLDVGCGSGLLLHGFRSRFPGSKLHGIEPELNFSKAAAIANDAFVFTGDIESFARENQQLHGTFDLITLNHVLEHLYDPVEKLELLHQFLKSNGYILIQVPYAFTDKAKSVMRMFHMAHVNQFANSTIKHTFARSGFDVIQDFPWAPRVITYLCSKGKPSLTVSTVPKINPNDLDSKFQFLRRKLFQESKIVHRKESSRRTNPLSFISNYYWRLKKEKALWKLLKGKKVLILGQSPNLEEMKHLPSDHVLMACNQSAILAASGILKKPFDLYLGQQSILETRKMKRMVPKIKSNYFLTDNLSYVQKTKELHSAYQLLLYDDGTDTQYLKKLTQPLPISDISSLEKPYLSPELRLVNFALHFDAKEINLLGFRFHDEVYFSNKRNKQGHHADIDKNFLDIISTKHKHLYSVSPNSPFNEYLPYRDIEKTQSPS